jgi:putative membrane protein
MSDRAARVLDRVSDRGFHLFAGALSLMVFGVLAYLLIGRDPAEAPGGRLRALPAVNAALNSTAALLLSTGWVCIRRGARRAHQSCMLAAFVTSTLFLVSYVAYHYVHGDTPYPGSGGLRAIYLAILASHVLCSMAVLPLALAALYWAAKGAFERHKKVTRWALPIWLYVSVTGVAIYFMLRSALSSGTPLA